MCVQLYTTYTCTVKTRLWILGLFFPLCIFFIFILTFLLLAMLSADSVDIFFFFLPRSNLIDLFDILNEVVTKCALCNTSCSTRAGFLCC